MALCYEIVALEFPRNSSDTMEDDSRDLVLMNFRTISSYGLYKVLFRGYEFVDMLTNVKGDRFIDEF